MKHLSSPTTVALAALLLAGVGGAATASTVDHPVAAKPGAIGKSSVTSAHIKNGTVKQKDLSPEVLAAIAATPTPPPPTPNTPPKAYAAAPEDSVNVPFDTDTLVVSQALPVGTYLVQADVTLYSTQSGVGSCSLLMDSDSYHLAQHTFPTGGGRSSLSLSSVIVVNPAKSVSVSCWTPATGNASEIRLSALQVTT